MAYTRVLKHSLPLMRGEDVLKVQLRLVKLGYSADVGQPDGLYGAGTAAGVEAFQRASGLSVDGKVGPNTWNTLFKATGGGGASGGGGGSAQGRIESWLVELIDAHRYRDSVTWLLAADGVRVDGDPPENTGGEPQTVRRIWRNYGPYIERWSRTYEVPAELIVATICTESGGKADAVREEPGYISDEATPNKVSPGLTQTLISTARDTLGDDGVDRAWLLQPENAIQAGTAYIARQSRQTHLDPPKVACAYNAGSIRYNRSEENRWKMVQYPIGTAEHCNRFVKWFNDCLRMFEADGNAPEQSFYRFLRQQA